MFVGGDTALPFFCISWSGFGIGVTLASQDESGSLPSAPRLWEGLYRTGTVSPETCGRLSRDPPGAGAFCSGRLLIVGSVSSTAMGLSRRLSSCVSFGKLRLPGLWSVAPCRHVWAQGARGTPSPSSRCPGVHSDALLPLLSLVVCVLRFSQRAWLEDYDSAPLLKE